MKNMKLIWFGFTILLIAGSLAIGLLAGRDDEEKSGDTATLQVENSASPSASPTAPVEKENEKNVEYSDDGFSPKTLTVKVGTTVNFINKSSSAMEVSSDPHPTHTIYKLLNGPNQKSGGIFTVVPDKVGSWGIHNHLNPSAKMTLVVQ